jgi:hypothetical protein
LELARLGCEFAQGYLFFKPLSAVAMTALAEFENQPAEAVAPAPDRPAEALREPDPAPVLQPVLAAPTTPRLPAPVPVLVAATSEATVQLSTTPRLATSSPAPAAALAPPTGRAAVEPRPVHEPTGEITHLLRPLLSN